MSIGVYISGRIVRPLPFRAVFRLKFPQLFLDLQGGIPDDLFPAHRVHYGQQHSCVPFFRGCSGVWDEAAKSATYKFGYFSQPERPPVRVTFHESEDIVIQRESGSHNIGYDAATPKVDVNYAMSHHFGVLMIIWQHDEFIVSYDLTGEI